LRESVTLIPGGGSEIVVPELELVPVQVVLFIPKPAAGEPPIEADIRRQGASKWKRVVSDFPLPPGEYEFRFRRKDYLPEVRPTHAKVGQETVEIRAPTWSVWSPAPSLGRLRELERAHGRGDENRIKQLLAKDAPEFEWERHARAWADIRSEWAEASREDDIALYEKADEAIAAYLAYLYQVEHPEFGTYRLLGSNRISLSFSLPAPIDAGGDEAGDLAARRERMLIWRNARNSLGAERGRRALAAALIELARDLRRKGHDEPARQCDFESEILKANPAVFPAEYVKATQPLSVYRWRAHASYQPNHSSLDVLRDLASYARKRGAMNEYDIRMALFAAYYTWINAIEEESEYAKETERLLATVVARARPNDAQRVMQYLVDLDKEVRVDAQAYPSLYVMVALTNMAGESSLKSAAAAWLRSKRDRDPTVRRKLSEMKADLELLHKLLAGTAHPPRPVAGVGAARDERDPA